MSESVALLLKTLRLPSFVSCHNTLSEVATRENWSYTDYLLRLCEQELADRYSRRVTETAMNEPKKALDKTGKDS